MGDRQPGSGELDLKRPDEMVKDLEPDEHEGEAVKGGDGLKLSGIKGESLDNTHTNEISVGP